MNAQSKSSLTLQELVATQGFAKAFSRMAEYTLRLGRESGLEVARKHPYHQDTTLSNIAYAVRMGLHDQIRIRQKPKYCYNKKGQDICRTYNDGDETILTIHTHPVREGQEARDWLRFSDDDIMNIITADDDKIKITNGTVVFPTNAKADILLWRTTWKENVNPKDNTPEVHEVYAEIKKFVDKIEDSLILDESGQRMLDIMRAHGRADIVSFELRNKTWTPSNKSKATLKQYLFK